MWHSMMRRLGRGMIAAVLVVIIGSLVGTSVAGATTTPNKDKVSGDGVRAASSPGSPTGSFSIDAWSSPTGVNPTGTMSVNFPGEASWSGPVVCLNVSANQATIVGQMDTASGLDTAVGGYFMTVVWDNGKPKGGVSPDRMSLIDWGTSVSDAFGPYTVAQVCSDPALILGSPLPQYSLLSGNINVTDAD